MSDLTPYDTGARAEPHPWVTPFGSTLVTASGEGLWPAAPDDFGKVDFDDEGGGTIATVYAERDPDGRYTLHVIEHVDGIRFQRHGSS